MKVTDRDREWDEPMRTWLPSEVAEAIATARAATDALFKEGL